MRINTTPTKLIFQNGLLSSKEGREQGLSLKKLSRLSILPPLSTHNIYLLWILHVFIYYLVHTNPYAFVRQSQSYLCYVCDQGKCQGPRKTLQDLKKKLFSLESTTINPFLYQNMRIDKIAIIGAFKTNIVYWKLVSYFSYL